MRESPSRHRYMARAGTTCLPPRQVAAEMEEEEPHGHLDIVRFQECSVAGAQLTTLQPEDSGGGESTRTGHKAAPLACAEGAEDSIRGNANGEH